MPAHPTLEFWYEFASTYSYLSAMRIEGLAEQAGVTVRWRPFLLGPIFAQKGWITSPFVLDPAKGAYMWRDMERQVAALGLPPLVRPDPFPQNSLLAARLALLGEGLDWGASFSKAVFRAEFARGADISETGVLADLLSGLGQDGYGLITRATAESNKARLKRQTEEAVERRIFGAPTFIAPDGELFWGNDRLESALAHAAR